MSQVSAWLLRKGLVNCCFLLLRFLFIVSAAIVAGVTSEDQPANANLLAFISFSVLTILWIFVDLFRTMPNGFTASTLRDLAFSFFEVATVIGLVVRQVISFEINMNLSVCSLILYMVFLREHAVYLCLTSNNIRKGRNFDCDTLINKVHAANIACVSLTALYLFTTLLAKCTQYGCLNRTARTLELEAMSPQIASRINQPTQAANPISFVMNRQGLHTESVTGESNELNEVRSLPRPKAVPFSVGEAFLTLERGESTPPPYSK